MPRHVLTPQDRARGRASQRQARKEAKAARRLAWAEARVRDLQARSDARHQAWIDRIGPEAMAKLMERLDREEAERAERRLRWQAFLANYGVIQ